MMQATAGGQREKSDSFNGQIMGSPKPLVVVAEDSTPHQEIIVAALRKAFKAAIDVEATDTYSVAVDILRKNAHRVCGVVTDVNYYPDLPQPGKHDDTERCGLRMIGEAKRIVPGVPVVLESDQRGYEDDARLLKADAFIAKDDIGSKGPDLFRKLFKPKLTNDLK